MLSLIAKDLMLQIMKTLSIKKLKPKNLYTMILPEF